MAKGAGKFIKVVFFTLIVFGAGWFSAGFYSYPKCQNLDIASDLLWPHTFKKNYISKIEYIEILRMDPDTGEVVKAKIMDSSEDIAELFSSSSGDYWRDREIDTHCLNVRMADGKLVELIVFNDSDLDGAINIVNAYCLGFRGIGDVEGVDDAYRAFGDGWVKLNDFMNEE